MKKPILIESKDFLIHPLRKIDFLRHDKIAEDLFSILSDDETTEFIPEKRIETIEQAKNLIFGAVLGAQTKNNFMHFITIKELNKVIGVINMIPPDKCKEAYKMIEYHWMIEYYINKVAWGRNIMSEILPAFIQRVKEQDINTIGAICHQKNTGSIRLLEKTGFKNKYHFDIIQDYYEL